MLFGNGGADIPGGARRRRGIELRGARVVDHDQLAIGIRGLGEVAGALERGGHGSGERSRRGIAQPFVGNEEERLVAPVVELGDADRPAQRAAELIAPECRDGLPGLVRVESVGVQVAVAQVLEERAVKGVAAGPQRVSLPSRRWCVRTRERRRWCTRDIPAPYRRPEFPRPDCSRRWCRWRRRSRYPWSLPWRR